MSKKIFLMLAVVFSGLISAQDYYDPYPDYQGYEYYDSSYDYPDDYYYNYPADYYPNQYYQGYYNDYRKAIYSVNWDRFFMQYNLTPWQIDQIIALNNRFANYAAWSAYYGWNPDRWYYDRFYALQNILGPRVFVVYQNVYFRGASPIVFYRNRCANFYAVRYPVRPVYRNVNINIYRVDRNNFRDGFRNSGNRNMGMIDTGSNNGFRTSQPTRSGANGNNMGMIRGSGNNGVRSQDNIRTQPNTDMNPGIRNSGGSRPGDGERTMAAPPSRQDNIRNNSGFRPNQNSDRSMENSGNNRSIQRSTTPSGGNRSSSSRLISN